MNLPAINIKMKNHNNQFKQDLSSGLDGFGLGIQVFKIESAKNMDSHFKSKNRTVIKNIENPVQPSNFKPPMVPKPKKLPSLQKSQSEINSKQRLSGFISTKIQIGSHHGYSDKIMERKLPSFESKTIVTPVSSSMRKKVGVSTQKNIISVNKNGSQTAKPFHVKNVPQDKLQVASKAKSVNLNQTAPPQMLYKAQELYYVSYHSQHEVLNKFFCEFQNCQKQNIKQINRLKKLKDFQMDPEAYDRVEYLLSLQGKIEVVIENMEKQKFQERNKEMAKLDEKKSKKIVNSVIPVSGFEWNEMQTFDYDPIEKYHFGDFTGSFKVNNYENMDLAPVTVQPKNDDQ